mmetsp:Transcript_75071/g.223756  ORF Transcript_75071/g.223756 Transcript_75071/m.223756 type:complete len:253 (+) Transcript_75071:368-1126(+)
MPHGQEEDPAQHRQEVQQIQQRQHDNIHSSRQRTYLASEQVLCCRQQPPQTLVQGHGWEGNQQEGYATARGHDDQGHATHEAPEGWPDPLHGAGDGKSQRLGEPNGPYRLHRALHALQEALELLGSPDSQRREEAQPAPHIEFIMSEPWLTCKVEVRKAKGASCRDHPDGGSGSQCCEDCRQSLIQRADPHHASPSSLLRQVRCIPGNSLLLPRTGLVPSPGHGQRSGRNNRDIHPSWQTGAPLQVQAERAA